jgi:DNA-directed RNA polymerase specialized sigma24 family protein
MASSIAAAFAEVEGPELDLLRGLVVPRRIPAPTDEGTRIRFEAFDYERHIGGIARALARRLRRHLADAEDAAHSAFLELLSKHPERLRQHPSTWLGWLYTAAHHRLLRITARVERAESIERLVEQTGDIALVGAHPWVSPTLNAEEESKHVPPPGRGEAWSRTQIIGAFQRFSERRHRPPRVKECKRLHGLPSPTTVYRCFGSFAAAVLAAGMVPERVNRRRRPWGPIEAAKVCWAFRMRHGRWPDRLDAERRPGELPGEAAMVRFFGGCRAGEVQRGAEAILAAAGGLAFG